MLEVNRFNAIRIRLASPDQIRSWSYGEVTKPETINYRTLKPERDGLFCERIFGPTKDWECACGKYKKIRYRGIICDKCGVEVTRSRVRRERMGHIELAAPVTHIWFLKGTPSRIGQIVDISPRDLEKIVYFASFIVTDLDEERRDEAIKSIEQDLASRLEELELEYQSRSSAALEQAEDQIAQLDAQLEDEIARLDAEAEAAIDSIKTEADNAKTILTESEGEKAPEEITLTGLAEPLVAAGAKITSEPLARIATAVAEATEQVTQKAEADKQGARDRFEAAKATQRKDADQAAVKIDEEKVQALADAKEYYEQRAEDLATLELYQLLSEPRYQQLSHTSSDVFEAGIGAEAVLELIHSVNLDELAEFLREELEAQSIQRRKKAIKRLKVVEAFRRSGNRPEWMIQSVLPVLPPDLRPMVQLDGGRFATSDLNDLYRRVINRNNRLKRLVELGAPEIIVRNEKRMLQEAVDALIDNGRRGRAVTGSSNHPYKSLSDMLRGKQGRFRQNLLGKRVDYSGRSVIVVGPHLKLNECGLPTKMALELFKPFVMRKLVDYGHASNIKSAKRMVEHPETVVWDSLEEVTRDHPVLLNRAPTLHRLGIQAFDIVLVKGSAIQIHPLVCTAFNADFDGDQMAVHVPLSRAAQDEAHQIMKSTRNILSPADGTPIISPTKDMVLGCYYLTEMAPPEQSNGDGALRRFADFEDARLAFENGRIGLQDPIQVLMTSKDLPLSDDAPPDSPFLETTVGRIIFNTALPRELRFVNDRLDKGALKRIIASVFYTEGVDTTVEVADRMKDLGMTWATRSGVTMGVQDLVIPGVKEKVLAETNALVESVEDNYSQGLITEDERYALTVKAWTDAMSTVSDSVSEYLDPLGPVYMMGNSGAAKGNFDQIRQISGMRGLMSDPSGRIIEMPVRANFREGLTVLEYFISTHGARKGLADTALRTADSGYLTRRLVDVAQDVIITGRDCGTEDGSWITTGEPGEVLDSVGDRAFGRFVLEPVVDPQTGEVLVPEELMISRELAQAIDDAGVKTVLVRSVMQCKNPRGVCQMCYGVDLARHELVDDGAAIGIIAAQSMGEPATQLTMRTFHLGGIASGTDIVQGLSRVEELFEARVPKGVAIMSDLNGTVELIDDDADKHLIRVTTAHVREYEYPIGKKMIPIVDDGAEVTAGATLALPPEQAEDLLKRKARSKSKTISKRALAKVAKAGISAEADGTVEIRKNRIVLRSESEDSVEYRVSVAAEVRVHNGQLVRKGDQLTEGSLNPQDILRLRGRGALHRYIVDEVQKVYRIVGVTVNDKHIEVIARQMLRRVIIDTSGDTQLLPGTLVDQHLFKQANAEMLDEGQSPATAHEVLLGVTKASLNNESFLAAASFQDTTRVLTEAVVEGKTDYLHGLKENVIIGKLIPAGTGWQHYQDALEAPVEAGELTDGGADASEAGDGGVGIAVKEIEPDGEGSGDAGIGGDGSEEISAESKLVDEVKPEAVEPTGEFSEFLASPEDESVEETSVDAGGGSEGDEVDDGDVVVDGESER